MIYPRIVCAKCGWKGKRRTGDFSEKPCPRCMENRSPEEKKRDEEEVKRLTLEINAHLIASRISPAVSDEVFTRALQIVRGES